MKIYISGPITGYANFNKEAFDSASTVIREAGHDPVNPQDLPHDHGKTWHEFMKVDIKAMLDCDAVLLLPGWANSRGATLEYRIALDLDMTFSEDLNFIIGKRLW